MGALDRARPAHLLGSGEIGWLQRWAGNAAVAGVIGGQRPSMFDAAGRGVVEQPRAAALTPRGRLTRSLDNRAPTLQRVYNDTGLRQVDAVAADVLLEALKGEGGAAELYKQATDRASRFNLIVTTDVVKGASYYGYTDVVYTGSNESFLFSADKFDVMRAVSGGLDLKIVINVPNAASTGQRLSTLVHEFGVHGTRIWSAMSQFNKPISSIKDEGNKKVQKAFSESDLKEVLELQLMSHAYDATFHHEEFGADEARDYQQLKANVNQALTAKQSITTGGFDFLASPFAPLGFGTDWAELQKQFGEATQAGESKHYAMYTHPKVEFEHLLKSAKELEVTASEFNARAKAQSGSFLTSLSTTAFEWGGGLSSFFGGSSEEKGKGKEKEKEHS
jgi:hypothetical protein